MYTAFPATLQRDVAIALRAIPLHETLNVTFCFQVTVDGETLTIPERFYCAEPSPEQWETLTRMQRLILHSLYSRHHDGFIRERHVRRLLPFCQQYNWLIPYVLRLAGEYVYEILTVIAPYIRYLNQIALRQFIADNRAFINRIEARMISYWNCYYRSQYPERSAYIGQQIWLDVRAVDW